MSLESLTTKELKNRAEYVLDSTVNLILAKHADLRRSKTLTYREYCINLTCESVKIYEKADKASKVTGTVPIECKKVYVDSRVSSFDGESYFWHASHFDNGLDIYGYIDSDDVES